MCITPTIKEKLSLDQCKARSFKFHRVCLFIVRCGRGPTQVHDRGAQPPPMNKFACKLHGYIVYLKTVLDLTGAPCTGGRIG